MSTDAFTAADWIAREDITLAPWQSIVLLDFFGVPSTCDHTTTEGSEQ